MPTLNISDFSCLSDATFKLAPVNVIIGPQGSGKSVTTKLFYFCTDVTNTAIQAAERGDTIELFKRNLARQFNMWFPPGAWGSGRFNINYYAGEFSLRILRRRSGGAPADEVSVTFSDWFVETYQSMSELFEGTRANVDLELHPDVPVRDVLDRAYRLRDEMSRTMARHLGSEYLAQQTFIPAGRAFFTSIGRLVAGLEHTGSLDPVTLKFARLFATLRDRNTFRSPSRVKVLGEEFMDRRKRFMAQLFGGEVRKEDDVEFVLAEDGRRIPFSSLSSGQQELLPMWSLIDYFNELDAVRRNSPSSITRQIRVNNDLIYIEEPEAHLFPSAQSLLMEFLIGSVASARNNRSLIITTHSPYIMAKLNVFLKAGQLARRKKRNSEINDIVPRECWLSDGELAAFSIEEGRLNNLLDDDGLIDGTYLDGVSEQIAREFSRLLQVESEI